mgnify:CR=1 FL=1
MVLLLRQRGRMTAGELARELEVSQRTVLRDVDALSTSGVPVYADRGRLGGFSLLPGFRGELTGLNHDEALALLTAGSSGGGQLFGLDGALASALRKVVDALPESNQSGLGAAAQRLLAEPATDLLSRRTEGEDIPSALLRPVREAVLAGKRLQIEYAAPAAPAASRTVDPIGLVTVRGRTYLLATRDGAERTYRLSRILSAERLPESAQRPARVDLDQLWARRCAQFLADHDFPVVLRVRRPRLSELLDMARAVRAEESELDHWVRLEVSFEDERHAVWAIWQLGDDADVLSPVSVRDILRQRAARLVTRYAGPADRAE